jgi:hypothetical protein
MCIGRALVKRMEEHAADERLALFIVAESKARRTLGRFSGSGGQVSNTRLLGAFCQIAHDAEIQSGTQTQALHAK